MKENADISGQDSVDRNDSTSRSIVWKKSTQQHDGMSQIRGKNQPNFEFFSTYFSEISQFLGNPKLRPVLLAVAEKSYSCENLDFLEDVIVYQAIQREDQRRGTDFNWEST